MTQHRALLALGVAASLVVAALALPGRSSASPQGVEGGMGLNQSWTKVDASVDFITQDKDSVIIYTPYRGTLKIISKYHDVPIRVINVNKAPKTAEE